MKLLVAIMTCHALDYKDPADPLNRDWWENYRSKDPRERQQAIRETWLRNLHDVDYKFFLGRPQKGVNRTQNGDEVFLDTKDTYRDNSEKVKAMCRWALDRDYDYMLRLDDDSYVYPDRLLQTDWSSYEYSGAPCGSFAIGAVTFFSRRAMQLIVDAPITHWADDAWVGTVMSAHGISLHELPSLHCKVGDEYVIQAENFPVQHRYSALHSCLPQVMRELYKRE